MLNVFDRFSRESQDLLYSLQRAGYTHPTIVLEPNGFLPDGVESPFLYFLGRPTGEKRGMRLVDGFLITAKKKRVSITKERPISESSSG